MRVHQTFHIKSRGPVVQLNEDPWDLTGVPSEGAQLRRVSDGTIWEVVGQETWWTLEPKRSCCFLIQPVIDAPKVGDEFELV